MAFLEISDSEGYFTNFADLSDKDLYANIQSKESNFVQNLTCLRELLKQEENREVTPEVIFRVLSSVLEVFSAHLTELQSSTPEECAVLTEVFRVLRNSCAGCERNQQIIKKNKKILEGTRDVCHYFLQHERTEKDLVCLRCASQFLGNAVTGSSENQECVWKLFWGLYRTLLLIEDGSLFNYTSSVVYNCIKHNDNILQLLHSEEGQEIVKAVIKQSREYEGEWGIFVLEELFLQDEFLKCVYANFNFTEKETLLEILLYKLKSSSEDRKPTPDTVTEIVHISEGNLLYLCELFISEAHNVLKISQIMDMEKLEPVLVKNHLECLCLATSQRDMYNKVKSDVQLLTAAVHLLHCMKAIGESTNNAFSEVNKMSNHHVSDVNHPVFGMKRDLIRLISNMAYKNKPNQDKVRELGGISLILDHTNIDGRNPYITQWSIFAVRNLCDNNMDNQAVIAGLKLEGVANNVEELRMYGVDAEVQDGKVVIKQISQQPRE